MAGETKETKAPEPQTAEESGVTEGKTRNLLIFGSVGVFAAIVFGLLYIFVISPSAPAEGAGWSVGWFLFSFAAGLTMIVLPCTLPLAFVIVPLSMGKGLLRGISMAIAFGVGVTVTLSIYGILAAILGGVAIDALGADLEVVKNWVYTIAGIFALIFALSEIGLMNIHMPTYSGAAPAFIQKKQEIIKAFLLGLFLGNIGIGCPHPATPLILIEIASSGDVLYGWLMFLVHAIGRVLPLLLLAFLAILGVNGLNWLMSRKAVVERVTGWAMVFVAGFILTLGLFTHDWWVNSGIHTQLEAITQESKFNEIFNRNFDTAVAHVHGLEDGTGLFGMPLEWGHWFLVTVWVIPIWWWWLRRRRELRGHSSFKIKALEKEIDALEKERRQVEGTVNLDEIEASFDLSARHVELDRLEAERREAEEQAQYGETGDFKNPIVQKYESRFLKLHRNYLVAVSLALGLIFVYFLPTNFYLASISGVGHDHGDTGTAAHDHEAGTTASGQSLDGVHITNGVVMNAAGEMIEGAHVMSDGTIMLANGTMMGPDGNRTPIAGGTIFSKSISGLPEAVGPQFVELEDGDTYNITASYVQKEIGDRILRMLAYNRSIPGPFIRAPQGAEVTINFTNESDVEQTIHSHGVRIDNNSDGVPYVTQDPVQPGESYTYTVKFEDAGVYWYHPHTREDYGQELGLYGNYLIDPSNADYWSPVNREVPLVIDDILIENNEIVDFYQEFTNFALLGRFGNQFLVNGEKDFTMTVQKGEVLRFLVTNVSNARPYNFTLPGVKMKLVGADIGRYEQEEFIDNFVISPAERVVVEAYFEEPGVYKLTHSFSGNEFEMARFLVTDAEVEVSYVDAFNNRRRNADVINTFSTFRDYLTKEPDKRLLLTVDLSAAPVIDHSAHGHMHADTSSSGAVDHSQHAHMTATGNRLDGIQWEDPGASDYTNTTDFVWWQLVDQDTGRISMDIPVSNWTFTQGDLVKVRLTNDANADHVMQHPIHYHGQRFVVLSENGIPNDNMAWKDTVLVFPGETVDILVEMSNLGEWMSHCHISEHLHAGMMMTFRVEDENGYASGDEYRAALLPSTAQSTNLGTQTNFTNTDTQPTQTAQTDPNAPQSLPYNFSDAVDSGGYFVTADRRFAKVDEDELIMLTFSDSQGNTMSLDDTLERVLSVTFVNSDNSVRFATYPGNTIFPEPVIQENIPETPGFDESLPHAHPPGSGHSLLQVPVAYAHGDVNDGHVVEGGKTYTVPVRFPARGIYRGFVAFTLAGETEPRVATFDIEVGSGNFSIDNFGWPETLKWWVLLLGSILLMIPLVWGVRKFINTTKV